MTARIPCHSRSFRPWSLALQGWAWWDWPLTWLTNCCLSVLWHCWLGISDPWNCSWNRLLCVKWDVKPYYIYTSELLTPQLRFDKSRKSRIAMLCSEVCRNCSMPPVSGWSTSVQLMVILHYTLPLSTASDKSLSFLLELWVTRLPAHRWTQC